MPLRSDAWIRYSAEGTDPLCDLEGKRKMYWCFVPEWEGCWRPAVHSPCVHNELTSLLARTLGPTPEFPGHKQLFREFGRLAKHARRLQVTRWSRERVVESYSGRLRKRYEQALVSLRQDSHINRLDRKINAFLKAEKFNPLQKPSKPRMIMARAPRFNLELASYLKPLEHALWNTLRSDAFRGFEPTRVVGKGLNARQRAALIGRKMEAIGEGCVVFEVDGKSFEAHVTRDDLVLEHKIYLTAFKGDRNLHGLLQTQLELKGRTMGGLTFRREGARASGDFNTGLGNTLIMLATCRAATKILDGWFGRTIRIDLLADGDNALVFVERSAAAMVHSRFAEAVLLVSSQELAVENPETVLERVVFGQSKPCWNGTEYIMVRDPLKTLSNSFSSYRHYDHWTHGLRVIKAVSQCELALARGIPVLQAYFATAAEQVGNVPDLVDPRPYLEGRLLEALTLVGSAGFSVHDLPEISAESRRSFAEAWGISVEEQLAMERHFSETVTFPHCGGPWSTIRRWVRGAKVIWSYVYVDDGPFSESYPENHLRLFLDSKG